MASGSICSTSRSRYPDALPLVITHGWPGSIVEFLKVIGPLTDPAAHGGDPADAFHVVCPSLPGYGFSDKPQRTGWGVERIAAAWAELMARLGYERYGAQGSDWGTSISARIGQSDPRPRGGHPPHPAARAAGPRDLRRLTTASAERSRRSSTPPSGNPATPWSTRRGRRRSATRSRTRRWRSPPGSSRSSGLGRTATATPRTCSRATSSSTTSCSTGCRGPARHQRGCTGRASSR